MPESWGRPLAAQSFGRLFSFARQNISFLLLFSLVTICLARPLGAHDGGAAAIVTVAAFTLPIAVPVSLWILQIFLGLGITGKWLHIALASLIIIGFLCGFVLFVRTRTTEMTQVMLFSTGTICLLGISLTNSAFAWFAKRSIKAAIFGGVYGIIALPAFTMLIPLFVLSVAWL